MKIIKIPFLLMIIQAVVISASAESFRGPLPQAQQDIIHYMAEHHAELIRKVTLTEDGYRARTTTENMELVQKLHEHIRYMKKRLDSGAMVRRWDPAYAEIVEHYEEIDAEIKPIKNGVEVRVTGKTPRAVKVAQNHANIVTSFVNEGYDSVKRKHPDTTQMEENSDDKTTTE